MPDIKENEPIYIYARMPIYPSWEIARDKSEQYVKRWTSPGDVYYAYVSRTGDLHQIADRPGGLPTGWLNLSHDNRPGVWLGLPDGSTVRAKEVFVGDSYGTTRRFKMVYVGDNYSTRRP